MIGIYDTLHNGCLCQLGAWDSKGNWLGFVQPCGSHCKFKLGSVRASERAASMQSSKGVGWWLNTFASLLHARVLASNCHQ